MRRVTGAKTNDAGLSRSATQRRALLTHAGIMVWPLLLRCELTIGHLLTHGHHCHTNKHIDRHQPHTIFHAEMDMAADVCAASRGPRPMMLACPDRQRFAVHCFPMCWLHLTRYHGVWPFPFRCELTIGHRITHTNHFHTNQHTDLHQPKFLW